MVRGYLQTSWRDGTFSVTLCIASASPVDHPAPRGTLPHPRHAPRPLGDVGDVHPPSPSSFHAARDPTYVDGVWSSDMYSLYLPCFFQPRSTFPRTCMRAHAWVGSDGSPASRSFPIHRLAAASFPGLSIQQLGPRWQLERHK